ncbi:ABC transporter ATP-binding protein [Burkholderia pyrrocinia]|uniref:ABC transporter ATP-binding protein n=1 Tax=Burkholderia pyrrocinia TaxID=60550 RepID=UPI00158F65EC
MSELTPASIQPDAAPAIREAPPVIELHDICMSFAKPSGAPLPVLAGVDLTLREGEILGLLGRSGSGKSTLLRIAGGLIKPSSGQVRYRGAPLAGPAEGIGVVFQTFALYPWLTVLDNVELGLDASGLPRDVVRQRALSVIELIGLDGFESAFPRELSGGMRQRVGFARALVGEPALLLMDEPFSALDVLTADTLRLDFLDLWAARQLPTKAVLLVTHNIEEAVQMCDRVLVLGAHPGQIVAELEISLPHPRQRLDSQFQALANEIYAILTARLVESLDAQRKGLPDFTQRLPMVSSHRIDGFIETLAVGSTNGYTELSKIAGPLLNVNELLPAAAALHLLAFAELHDGAIRLTAAGRVYAQGHAADRKRLLREHLEHFVPLASHIRAILDERDGHRAPRERFELELEDHLNRQDAADTLRTVIDWGRASGLYTYDDATRMFGAGDD